MDRLRVRIVVERTMRVEADTLILMLAPGASLEKWQRAGILEREWALPVALFEKYARGVLVSFGGEQEAEILKTILPATLAERVSLVCNERGDIDSEYEKRLRDAVLSHCKHGSRAVIRTTQMSRGRIPVQVCERLRAAGVPVALIARGGHLWTRFLANSHGADSDIAIGAADEEGALCRAADVIIGSTEPMVKDLAWRYSFSMDKTRIVPNYFYGTTLGDPSTRDRGLVVHTGQLVARKRVDTLIKAIADVAKIQPHARLEVIGDGPELPYLTSLTKQLNAPVTFYTNFTHEQRIERLQQCGVYVHASDMESQPKSVIEALSCGCAAVVAASPGLGMLVQHGVTGIRCDGTVDGFALVLQELVVDDEWRAAMGPAAAQDIRGKYTLSSVISLELEAHQEAMRRAFGDGDSRVAA